VDINVTFDSSVSGAPAAFETVVNAVIAFLDATFSDPITINIDVGYGEIDGQSLGSNVGESETEVQDYSFSQVRNALIADATTVDDYTSTASLPTSDPVPGGGTYEMSTAEAKALGLAVRNGQVDGYVGFGSSVAFDYDNSNGISWGSIDFYGVVAHEITEVMGREFGNGTFYPFELFHYSASGVLDFSGTQPGYFSIDGGVTDLADFNTDPSGDFGDWADSVGDDPFRAFVPTGVTLPISETDLRVLDVIGYDRVTASTGPARPFDFNGDGNSDLLWESTNGHATVWLMSGTKVSSSRNVSSKTMSGQIEGSADFDGDGKADILWQNDNASATIWFMNGSTLVNSASVGENPGAAWHIKGTGDFNGDGDADILWQSDSGQAAIWMLNGSSVVSGAYVGSNPGPSWQIVGSGDFNGDGKSDILLQNTNGQAAIWTLNGGSITGGFIVGSNPGSAWHIRGVGDFDGDGKADILWQNASGQVAIWFWNGSAVTGGALVGNNPGPNWQVKGTGDYNHDGKADILLQNSSGQAAIWLMNGASISSGQYVSGAQGSSLQLVTSTV
jgi:FG-GAP-like repeat